ncbi:GPI mannosyltransferase 3 [Euwallacea similis]|uniref:GPI mannosyltransferase 3 n=1 Tax=Euwallacea similis TaxID=1736056 RepID=UPI00344D5D22
MHLKNFKNVDVFLIFVLIRVLSVFIVQTFFVPDEYYQSLEVAHRLVFGYGHLTWEWHQGIRSYGYPLLFALLYKVLYTLGLDSPQVVIYVPRIAQALLSAYSDLCFYRWSGTKKWAVFSICSSWFWFYTCSRTLINTFETSFTTIALSHFPWLGKGPETSSSFIWIAAGLFCIRATSAVIWLPMCLFHLCISQTKAFKLVTTKYIPIGLIVLTMSIILDSLCYGSFQITTYNFLKANIFQNVATNYGTQPWHWYLSSGIPTILGIQILPFIMGVLVVLKARQNHLNELAMLGTVIFATLIFSLLPHKEFRFLLPLLPIMLFVSSRFLSAWSRKASRASVWLATFIIFIGSLLPAYYIGYNHQRGTLDVMEELQHIALKDPENVSLLFLMPCHSTPLYSHIHINVKTRFLTCNPNLDGIEDYIDEADQFYAKPNNWLRQNYPPNSTLPSHIVCFDTLVPLIGNDILTRYKRIKQFFHCDFPLSSRIGANVLIHERKDFEILWTT